MKIEKIIGREVLDSRGTRVMQSWLNASLKTP